MEYKTFDGLNVSSKFAICGLPIRMDSYKTCSFGCKYCFSNNRKIMEFKKDIQIADIDKIKRTLNRILTLKKINDSNFLDRLISDNYTWHCGGMSDPFQPIEKELHITRDIVNVTNEYGIHILFSTKSDNLYSDIYRPDLHTFQLSVTNVHNRKDIEPNVPNIEDRYKFYRSLKDNGFKVGIRIQPFIPNVSDDSIIDMFHDADHFTIEGLKIVPQNDEEKKYIYNHLNLNPNMFTQMGLLNIKPNLRIEMYKPIIAKLKHLGASYSISDNDMRYLSNNMCCCGDALVNKYTSFNTTTMIMKYGKSYNMNNVKKEYTPYSLCKCSHLFTSNRTNGCITLNDFYEKRFLKNSSPFSPNFQYDNSQQSLF